jgi:pyridinium-3,5-bisthiocarboxylic acid mononucleotide nickel chelatase
VQGLHLHLDLPAGVAGDMTLGALFDCGVPEAVVRDVVAKLPVSGWDLHVEKTLRRGLAGTDVKVLIRGKTESHHDHTHEHEHGHPHTHYADIRAMLSSGVLAADVQKLALAIFDRLARAEARLHGTTIDQVAFHEVGALDSIVDIVGTAAAIAWLRPAGVSASPVAMGHGTIKTSHGILPVPAPAALEILREAGAPMVDGDIATELCTPTGAAIVAALATSYGSMPSMTVKAIGYGAGDNDFPDRPNLVRAVLGERAADSRPEASLLRVEANLDDMIPELCEHVAERLFAAGAVDVWWTPVTMKKGRPAFVLSALAPAPAFEAVCDTILAETTSIGVRFDAVERRLLDRRSETVETPFGPISLKVATRQGKVVNVAPEYESCRAAARSHGVPLKDVYAAALAAYRR